MDPRGRAGRRHLDHGDLDGHGNGLPRLARGPRPRPRHRHPALAGPAHVMVDIAPDRAGKSSRAPTALGLRNPTPRHLYALQPAPHGSQRIPLSRAQPRPPHVIPNLTHRLVSRILLILSWHPSPIAPNHIVGGAPAAVPLRTAAAGRKERSDARHPVQYTGFTRSLQPLLPPPTGAAGRSPCRAPPLGQQRGEVPRPRMSPARSQARIPPPARARSRDRRPPAAARALQARARSRPSRHMAPDQVSPIPSVWRRTLLRRCWSPRSQPRPQTPR
jgi:hypothetical protein